MDYESKYKQSQDNIELHHNNKRRFLFTFASFFIIKLKFKEMIKSVK